MQKFTVEKLGPFKEIIIPILPRVAIITGRNGSGKTSLLKAMSEKKIIPIGYERRKSAFYNASNFASTEAGVMTAASAATPHEAYAYFVSNKKVQFQVAYETLVTQTNGVISEVNFQNHLASFRAQENMEHASAWLVYSRSVFESLTAATTMSAGRGIPTVEQRSNPLLLRAIEVSSRLPHKIEVSDLEKACSTWSFYDPLSTRVSEVFLAFLKNRELTAFELNETNFVSRAEAYASYDAKHTPPWDVLNIMLKEVRNAVPNNYFNFEFGRPDNISPLSLLDGSQKYRSILLSTETGLEVAFDKLSSGESVLLSLCLLQFNYLGVNNLNMILLFDEIDSVLHPSMIKFMMAVLEDISVRTDSKILLATHSPTTVSLATEGCIFEIVRFAEKMTVAQVLRDDAIEMLSDGLFTVNTAISILKESTAKVVILSEGHNVSVIRKFCSFYFKEEVCVLSGLEHCSGVTQLHTIFQFVCSVVPAGPTYLFVLDSDAAKEVSSWQALNRVETYCMKKCEDSIADRGIESSFSKSVLQPFSDTLKVTKSSGDIIENTKFDKARKKDFAEYISTKGTEGDFTSFSDLKIKIENLLLAKQA